MRILLINPIVEFYSEKVNNFPYMTLGLLYLAAVAEKDGHDVFIRNSHYSTFKKTLREIRPDLVAITCVTAQYNQALKIATVVKKFNKKIITIIGGYHPTALWGDILKETDAFDYICVGEGEITFKEFLLAISSSGNALNVKGLAFKNGKEVIFTGARELISDLDSLPLPARHLVEFRVPFVATSRGCRNNCKFCSVKNFYGRKYRIRSIDSIIKEIADLRSQGNRRICFIDDNFGGDRDYILKFSKAIKEAGLNDVEFEIDCSIAILSDESVLEALREMNVKMIGVGIQSSINELREYLNLIGNENFLKSFFQKIKKYDFNVWLFFPLNSGKENETMAMIEKDLYSFMKTVKENADGKAKFFCNLTVLIPFPGTDLEREFHQRNIYIEKNWPLFRQRFCTYGYNDITEDGLNEIITRVDKQNFLPYREKKDKRMLFWELIFLTDVSFTIKIKMITWDMYLSFIKKATLTQRLRVLSGKYF